ncbi:hypothetical protein F2Q69_00001780 [Brassica cretica]|uniref:S-adenosylmethionine synthase n=1 Tax=Brassica cretica TaxID=69181 RepID=A0A8S9PCC1_BRACR|nr:hypothetical protein F2Q69_00001780 [Brassica cretica]
METFLFTSESVNEGHPDKLCDQVSDAILDACLEQDPESKVACETCTKTNMVMVFGEITTSAKVDYEKIVRSTCREIGFVSADVGLDADKCNVLVNIEQQSPDIAQGVHGHLTKKPEDIGAGDQGHMFGYATDETPELMPLTHVLATKLGAKLTEVRKNKTCPWLRPDGKTQVTVEYKNDGGAMIPIRVHTVLISTQHDETVTNDEIAADLKEHVIKPVIPAKYLDENTIFHLNPSGRFVIGGPHGDAGLTGRKIIIDTYGGWGAHGGGAFSGKDPTKVDRSGAYIVRQAAKSVVAAGLARRCIVQVSYAIGVPEPLSVFVDTYKTGTIPDKDILVLIKEAFDFRPGMMAINLDLKRGGNFRFQKTAAYGHFGREDPDFTWEGDWKDVLSNLDEADTTSFGVIVNTFEELEPAYVKELKEARDGKVWTLGPVALCNKVGADQAERGKKADINQEDCLKWLDSKEEGSVLYVCLGSICNLTLDQLKELGLGLEESKRPFIWVIRSWDKYDELAEWILESGFEERIKERGLLIKGWSPQMIILQHVSVGGFLTHCGWNSTLEGITSGLPLLTWPLFADQFSNEKLVVQVLKSGVRVGVDEPMIWGEEEKIGVLVDKEGVKKAVEELMGDSDDAKERRRRAKGLGELAHKAVDKGGSSHSNITLLIEDIMDQVKSRN